MLKTILSNRYIFDMLGSRRWRSSFSTFHEYLLVVHPGEEIGGKVIRLKTEMLADLIDNASLHSKPHFTIVSLILPVCLESRLLRALTAACAAHAPKQILVDGLGCFPNGNGRNVIFIKTDESAFFADLQARIRRALRMEGIKRSGIYPSIPHLTVAKDLSNASFKAWWRTLENERYNNSFCAAELVVLRRRLVRYAKCEELARLPFLNKGNLPINPRVRQLRLF